MRHDAPRDRGLSHRDEAAPVKPYVAALAPILEPRSRQVVEEREVRWMAYQLVTSVALALAISVATRASGKRLWWLNLLAVPALGVASTTGSVLGGAGVFRAWYALTKRRASNDIIMNGRILGAVGTVVPLRALLARFLIDRAWPSVRVHPAVWGVLTIPLLVALAAIDDSADEAEAEHQRRRRDPLTGARSDRALSEDIATLRAARVAFWLVAFDLDGFKAVNDQLGHIAADDMLVAIADRLRSLEPTAITYRLHGDEFELVAAGVDQEVEAVVRRASAAIREVGHAIGVVVTGSFGVAPAVEGEDERDFRKRADDAATRAKHGGKARAEFQSGTVILL